MKKSPPKISTDPAVITRRCLKCLEEVKKVQGLDDLQVAHALKCKLYDLDDWRAGIRTMRLKHLERALKHFKVSLYWITFGQGRMLFGPENKAA
jgi:hypothetical protein